MPNGQNVEFCVKHSKTARLWSIRHKSLQRSSFKKTCHFQNISPSDHYVFSLVENILPPASPHAGTFSINIYISCYFFSSTGCRRCTVTLKTMNSGLLPPSIVSEKRKSKCNVSETGCFRPQVKRDKLDSKSWWSVSCFPHSYCLSPLSDSAFPTANSRT
jgi:hypothetical protein